jgi:hypothetical protein
MSKLIGKIFYDKRYNLVFHVKAKSSKGYLCGGYTQFLGDAKTYIERQILTEKYITRCKKIVNFDKCNFIELDEQIGAWRVKR